ncbi:MAG: DUF4375 domain-containing protein [Planctomycetota bacterium]
MPRSRLQSRGFVDADLSLADEDLALSASELAGDWLDEAGGAFGSKVHQLPPAWRRVWTLLYLEGQVNNGGFHQFFVNTRGHHDEHLLEDLAGLDHDSYREIIERAFVKYRKHDYRAQWENIGKDWETFSQPNRERRFGEEDSAFYAIDEGLSEVLGRQIRRDFDAYRSLPPHTTQRPAHSWLRRWSWSPWLVGLFMAWYLWRVGPGGLTTINYIGVAVLTLWFVMAVCNTLTRGKMLDWLYDD